MSFLLTLSMAPVLNRRFFVFFILMEKNVAKRNLVCYNTLDWFDGCIAQLVEQLTLNQWVQGSSPCAPTKEKKPSFKGGFLLLWQCVMFFNFCNKK